MNAIIKWRGGRGRIIIEDLAEPMWDPRIKEVLDDLAKQRAPDVTLTFEDETTGDSDA